MSAGSLVRTMPGQNCGATQTPGRRAEVFFIKSLQIADVMQICTDI